MNLHNGCDFQCEIRSKVFRSKVYLKKHLKTHDNISQFNCAKCEKVFQSKEALSKHIKTKHENVKYICSYCSSSFSDNYHMKVHEVKLKDLSR